MTNIKTITLTKAKLSECLRASKIINDNEEIKYASWSPAQGYLRFTTEKVFETIKEE